MTLLRDVPMTRRPAAGRPPHFGVDRGIPVVVAAVAAALLALLLLAGALWSAPDRLDQTRLAGPRMLQGRACVVVAADLSGSMSEVTPQRRSAEALLLPWLKTNLRPDDLVMELQFSDQATEVLPITEAAKLPAVMPPDAQPGSGGTLFEPTVDRVAETMGRSGCAATGLLVISDGAFGDEAPVLAGALQEAGVTRMYVLNPNGNERVRPLDQPDLAGVAVEALGGTDQMSITFGRAVADLTGQNLSRA